MQGSRGTRLFTLYCFFFVFFLFFHYCHQRGIPLSSSSWSPESRGSKAFSLIESCSEHDQLAIPIRAQVKGHLCTVGFKVEVLIGEKWVGRRTSNKQFIRGGHSL